MYYWCSRCYRAFCSVEVCPSQCNFLDCESDVYDIRPWEVILKKNPSYPEIPEIGKKYSFELS
jgi:hypothetical protein